jgi:hypothetical protein
MTEDQGREKSSQATTRAEAAARLRVEASQGLAKHQAATGIGEPCRVAQLSFRSGWSLGACGVRYVELLAQAGLG